MLSGASSNISAARTSNPSRIGAAPNEVLAADPPYQRGGRAVATLLTCCSAQRAVLPFGGRLKRSVSWAGESVKRTK